MSKIEDGGPAFPQRDIESFRADDFEMCSTIVERGGMSLRDWFAGQALAGLLGNDQRGGPMPTFAAEAYEAADAMIAARNGGKS